MASRFGWIDFADDDRQQMLDILKLFALRDTRDELGIGTVRDAFANYFFPGTTTIQTRARYFLIVPWVYQEAVSRGNVKKWSATRLSQEVDYLERSIISSLKEGGETDGVIGGWVGKHVERLPNNIYWPGLAALNFRTVNQIGRLTKTRLVPAGLWTTKARRSVNLSPEPVNDNS